MKPLTLSDDRREALAGHLQRLFAEEFGETLSDFQAGIVIDLMLKQLGPAVYNQAVEDVRAHLQDKLDDLSGEVWVDGGV
ncbi:DUF2164 domain-containing protein [uncultured Hyphomonas sp.]|uniref:DUF2164 domain-containing protein n=1 Tax=uncultured Hyphomonas sp. TaxID=225298 RepID=UPI002AAB966E|nr:DUF2164 domain-containing protein [uncultured Hyphomonas sp.]